MKVIWLLVLLAGPALADEPSNAELCVRHAMTLITGQPLMGLSESDLATQLHARGETCADPSYMQAAAQRVQNLQWQAQQLAQLQQEREQLQARLEREQAEARDARIRAAGRAYIEQQQQQRVPTPPRPTTTTCRDTTVGVQCTTF